MNCPNCGVKLASISKFCPECGAKLTAQEEKKNIKEPDSIEELLVNIVQNYGGPELYKESNARKLAGLLKDFAGSNFQDEVKLLSRVVPEGVQEVLFKANNSSSEEKQGALAACKMKMLEDLFLNEAKAADATNILAAGLGWEIKGNVEAKSENKIDTKIDNSENDISPAAQAILEVHKALKGFDDPFVDEPWRVELRAMLKQKFDSIKKDLENERDEKSSNVAENKSDREDPCELYQLAEKYYYGLSVKKNCQKAFELYQKAAELGNADAQYKIGWMYSTGTQTKQDYKNAFKWFSKSAEQGCAIAQYNLGKMYWYGYGVEKNEKKSFEWVQKAADQGFPKALNQLGYMYERGYVVEKDEVKANELFQKAEEQGYTGSHYGWSLF